MSTTQVPPQQGLPPKVTKNGLGIAAFVLGIVGSVIGLIPLLGIPAIILGLIGIGLALGAFRRLHKGGADNRVMTWFGAVLSVLAVILGVVGVAIVNKSVNDLNNSLNAASAPTATASANPCPSGMAPDANGVCNPGGITPATPTEQPTTPSEPATLTSGDQATVTDSSTGATEGTIAVTIEKVTTKPADPSYGEPPANGYFVIAKITATADPGYTDGFDVNALDFIALLHGQQYQYSDGNSMYALTNAQESSDITATLGASQTRTGYEAFDVPAQHGQIAYAPNMDGQPLAAWSF